MNSNFDIVLFMMMLSHHIIFWSILLLGLLGITTLINSPYANWYMWKWKTIFNKKKDEQK